MVGAGLRLAGRHPVPMVCVALLVALPIQLSGLLLAADHRVIDAVALPLILCVLPYLAVELSAAALAQGVAVAHAGGRPDWSWSFGLAARRPDVLVVLAVQAAMAYVAFFTFVGAMAVIVWWGVAPVVLVLEGFPPREAISRSFRLMNLQFASNAVALVGGWLTLYIPAIAAASQLGSLIHATSGVALDAHFSLAYVPVTPLLAVIVVLRYIDRRVVNESASFRAV
jgi:hypothetical protein